MNFKKIMSLVLSVMMILTSVSVFGTEIETPNALVTSEITGADLVVKAVPHYAATYPLTDEYAEDVELDFGMSFATTEDYDHAVKEEYFNYVVDFKLSFSQDATALLAGQYSLFSDMWISVKEEKYTEDAIGGLTGDVDGLTFKGGEENAIYIMKDSGLDPYFTYEEVIAIEKFNCGVKFAYDTPSGVTAKLSLVMFPVIATEHEGAHYVDGVCEFVKDGVCYVVDRTNEVVLDTVEYTYNNALGINTATTDNKKAEIIEEKLEEIVATEEAAKGALDIIGTLTQEVKDEIAPETVKALIEATGEVIEDTTSEVKVYGVALNNAVEIDVNVATTPDDRFEDYMSGEAEVVVYDIDATKNSAPVDYIDVPVLIAIPVADSSLVTKVLHLHDNNMEEVEFIRGEKVIFVQASKFSQYSVYSNSPLAAGEAELKLVARNDAPRGQAWFDVVLAGADNATIKGFISGEFTITPANTDASFEYELTWADEDKNKEIAINYTALDGKENGAREYNIHVNEFNKATSYTVVDGVSEIKLAKLVVTAYGAGEFEISDSLLVRFDYDLEAENLEEEINVVRETGAAYEIDAPAQKLTIEIDFNHATETNNAINYQDMWIELVKPEGVEAIKLGNGNGDITILPNKYIVEKTVLANTKYTVMLKGAGYRTAIYNNLNMREDDVTIKFWNNYKDDVYAMEYRNGALVDVSKRNSNFLAGDIVMDREINIYDLSAVVSYFGERNIIGVKDDYVKYDLNRDGDINSIDVAILLTSWGK